MYFLVLCFRFIDKAPIYARETPQKTDTDLHTVFFPAGFLLAYCITLLVVALPTSVLELTMAQFSSLGTVTIFRCLPVLTG